MSFCVHVASIAAFAGIGWFQASLAGKMLHPPTEGDVCAPPSPGGTLASGRLFFASVAARASVIAPPPAVPPLPAVLFPVPPALFEPPALFAPPALLEPPALLAPPLAFEPALFPALPVVLTDPSGRARRCSGGGVRTVDRAVVRTAGDRGNDAQSQRCTEDTHAFLHH